MTMSMERRLVGAALAAAVFAALLMLAGAGGRATLAGYVAAALAILARWPSRGFDGVYTGDPETGDLVEVCDPAWWQVRRWVEWHTTARQRVMVRMARGAEVVELRAISARFVPMSPRRRYVARRQARH
jgi:hypothetical protein